MLGAVEWLFGREPCRPNGEHLPAWQRLPGGLMMVDLIEVPMEPRFFATPAEFRAWLEEHHDQARELWVGFYKVGSGRPSITWPQRSEERRVGKECRSR